MLSKFTRLSKNLIIFIVFTILSFLVVVPVHAQSRLVPPTDSGSNLFFGQQHSYSVFFRSNGEAVVYARIALKNMDDALIQQFKFALPEVDASEMTVYQQVLPKQCIRYDYQSKEQSNCLEYAEPDYFNYYSYSYPSSSLSQVIYNKLAVAQTSNVYSVNLTETVQTGKSTALIIAYTTKSYTKNVFGLTKFKFETLQVSQRVSESHIAIDVDEDLYLKDKKSSVNYSTSNVAVARDAMSSYAPESTKSLDYVSQNIGVYGSMVKSTKNLAAGETFIVKGEYARSWWRLYLSSMLTAVIITCGLLGLMTLVLIHFRHRRVLDKNTSKIKEPSGLMQWVHLNYVLVGFGSALLAVFMIFITNLLRQSVWFNVSDFFFNIMTGMVVLVGFFLAVFGPAIFIGIKAGFKGFLMVLIFTFMWLVLFFLVFAILFNAGNQFAVQPYPLGQPAYYGEVLKK